MRWVCAAPQPFTENPGQCQNMALLWIGKISDGVWNAVYCFDVSSKEICQ